MTRFLVAALSALPLVAIALPAAAQPVAPPPGAYVQPAPTYVGAYAYAAPAPAPLPPTRWTIGARFTGTALLPAGEAFHQSEFTGAGLAVGYHLSPALELSGELELANNAVQDGGKAQALTTMTLTARYHLAPFATIDPYLIGGLGGATLTIPEPSRRAIATIGVGVEKRIGAFGVSAELRALSYSDELTADGSAASPRWSNGNGPGPYSYDLTGGGDAVSLTVGTSYHF
jgi:hypothetical protein